MDENINDLLRHITEQGLALSEAEHWRLIETSPMAIEIVRPDGIAVYVNPSAQHVFGRTREEYSSYNIANSYVDVADRQTVLEALRRDGYIHDVEVRFRRSDGEVIWVSLSATLLQLPQGPATFVWLQDTTRRKRLEEELRLQAFHDALTGIANRRRLIEVGATETHRARRFGHPLTTLLLDVDGFKSINDTWGHAVGDQVLQAMAAACQASAREVDLVSRMGGDEFALLFPETDLTSALVVAERHRRRVEDLEINVVGGPSLRITTSIGVATLTDALPDLDALLGQADMALYRAKREGRNRVCAAPAEQAPC